MNQKNVRETVSMVLRFLPKTHTMVIEIDPKLNGARSFFAPLVAVVQQVTPQGVGEPLVLTRINGRMTGQQADRYAAALKKASELCELALTYGSVEQAWFRTFTEELNNTATIH